MLLGSLLIPSVLKQILMLTILWLIFFHIVITLYMECELRCVMQVPLAWNLHLGLDIPEDHQRIRSVRNTHNSRKLQHLVNWSCSWSKTVIVLYVNRQEGDYFIPGNKALPHQLRAGHAT